MKAMLLAASGKTGRIVALIVSQIFGGVILGIVAVAAIGLFIAAVQGTGPLPGDWRCSTKQVKTVDLVNVHFEFQAEECDAGGRYVQIKTAITASRRGDASSTKIFEYLVSRRGGGKLMIEEVDARTVRISMPDEEEADRESTAARYMGLRTWRDLTFVYGRNPSDAPSGKVQ